VSTKQQQRVAIYVRISDDEEGTGKGVDAQETDCRKRAERESWRIVKVYRENDVARHGTARSRDLSTRPCLRARTVASLT
jgi:DNA invertase Pin-like site-specific DNA recombinase